MTTANDRLGAMVRQAYRQATKQIRNLAIFAVGFAAIAVWSYDDGWVFWMSAAIAVVYVALIAFNYSLSSGAKQARVLDVVLCDPARIVWVGIEPTSRRRVLVQLLDDRGECWPLAMPEESAQEFRGLVADLFPDAYRGPVKGEKFAAWAREPSAPRRWPRTQEGDIARDPARPETGPPSAV